MVDDDERAIDQPTEPVERGEAGVSVARVRGCRASRQDPLGRDGGRRLERPAAGEDRQSAEQPAVRLVEQVPAPVDERLERLLARHRGPTSARQQPEPVTEALGDLLGPRAR